jgi:hypothetical protein
VRIGVHDEAGGPSALPYEDRRDLSGATTDVEDGWAVRPEKAERGPVAAKVEPFLDPPNQAGIIAAGSRGE